MDGDEDEDATDLDATDLDATDLDAAGGDEPMPTFTPVADGPVDRRD